jgi:hypothetical protein
MQTVNGIELDTFTYAYLTCALWSTDDNSDPETGGEPFNRNYTLDDVHPDTLRKMVEDCNAFRSMEWNFLKADAPGNSIKRTIAVEKLLRLAERIGNAKGDTYAGDERNGHDFWLTREGHGVGFWDRGYGRVGSILTDAASSFGGFNLYLGDDGMIHGS